MIGGDYYYVDKTGFAHQLIERGKYFFLSRPRRFGKSLLLDTLQELFEANEPLFRGLYIHDKWDWSTRYPVVRLSFGSGVLRNREELDLRIRQLLRENRERLALDAPPATDIAGEFSELVRRAYRKYGQPVVLLIDEYDKPILDNITQHEAATELREGLKNLYSAIKDCDDVLRFCLLTGVSKFSKVSLFSGLNNLKDITLDARYSALCGYTDEDIDTVFAPELADLDREQIRRWYNGYNWLGESVYNPFDILLLFDERQFRPYWFESATPTFLVKLLAERGVFTPQLAQLQTGPTLLSRFDVQDIGTEALLFQTGYLTIKSAEQPVLGMWNYILSYPNREVETSLNEALLPAYGVTAQAAQQNRVQLIRALQCHDFDQLQAHFKALFAAIPHDWYRNNPIARFEGHYASVFYSHLAAIGLDLIVEDANNAGQVDLTLHCNGHYYLFEFKVVKLKPDGKAIAQIKEKDYAAKYRARGLPIHLIGIEFSREKRQIVGFDVETDR
jgi:hypothetical protein